MLKLKDSEKQELKHDLEKFITMVNKLSEIDTSGVKPLRNVHSHKQALREDIIGNSLTKQQALGNSKKEDQNYFLVPKVVRKTK